MQTRLGSASAYMEGADETSGQVMDLFSPAELRVVEPVTPPLPEHEVVQLNDIIGAHSDVLQAYIRAHAGPFGRPLIPVYTWVLTETSSIEPLARICIMKETASFSSLFLREWSDKIAGRTMSVSLADPVLPPPTLRVTPVDVLAIPSDLLEGGSRLYLLELIGDFLPRRMAVRCGAFDSFQMLVDRVGMREICAFPRNACFLVHTDAQGTRIWTGRDTVRERHGTAFQLVVEQSAVCLEALPDDEQPVEFGLWQTEVFLHDLPAQLGEASGVLDSLSEPVLLYQTFLLYSSPFVVSTTPEDEQVDLDETVQQHLQWHREIQRIDRLTTFHGFAVLQAEAVAFRRSRGSWPELMVSGLIQDTVLFLDVEFAAGFPGPNSAGSDQIPDRATSFTFLPSDIGSCATATYGA